MSDTGHPAIFTITVKDLGPFTFKRRTMRDELSIAAELSRLTEGVPNPTPYLATVAGWISTLKVLTVKAPDDWNIDEMDPLDEDTYSKLMKAHTALREKEGSFRLKPSQAGEAQRA